MGLFTSLPLLVCALFTVLLALEWNNRLLRGQRTLLCFMFTTTVLYAGHYVYFNHNVLLMPYADVAYTAAHLAVYPLYLIYIVRLTSRWHRAWLWLLLPALLGAGAQLWATSQQQEWVDQVRKVVFYLEVIATVAIGSRLISRYNRMVDQYYADTEKKSMRNVQNILYLVMVIALLSFAANTIGRHWFTSHTQLLYVFSALFSALLFMIGYAGLHREFSVVDMERDKGVMPDKAVRQQAAALSNLPLKERIVRQMEDQKIYLQNDLKLEDLASIMHTNRTYIYLTLNREMGMSFNEFINRYRIAHAERLLDSDPTLSATELAAQSGFASLSSYYRNLKKYKRQD